MDQAESLGLREAVERGCASVCTAVNGLAWLLEEQQEIFVQAPLGCEESLDVRNS